MSLSTISRINPQKVYSDAVTFGRQAFLRGATPTDRSQDLAGQTRQVLATLDELLAASGSHKGALLSATVYMTDIGQRDIMNGLWAEWLGAGNAPARATVGVSSLGTPDCLIEISVVAAT